MTNSITKNIDFIVDGFGNLIGSHNPLSQNSSNSNYADRMLPQLATDVNGNIIATVLNQVGALATLKGLSGNPGQIMVPNDATNEIVVQFPGGTKSIGALKSEQGFMPGPLFSQATLTPRAVHIPCSFVPKLAIIGIGEGLGAPYSLCFITSDTGIGIGSFGALGSGFSGTPAAFSPDGNSMCVPTSVTLSATGLEIADWGSTATGVPAAAVFTPVIMIMFFG
jgi:hypothetical protein